MPLSTPLHSISVALCFALGAIAAPPCNTPDVPLVWSMSFTQGASPSAIYSDGANGSNPSYVHGVDNVTAVINSCSPTRDATLNVLTGRPRKMGFNFSNVVFSNSLTPVWASSPMLAPGFINVRFLSYVPIGKTSNDEFWFVTRMSGHLTPPDRIQYTFDSSNPNVIPEVPQSTRPNVNFPNVTAPVIVHHIPAAGGAPETWEVYPDPAEPISNPQILTLYKHTKSGQLYAGQIKAPFFFTITRK